MSERQKPVLVTGAGGFIGRHLCRRLLSAGYSVRAMSRSAAPGDLTPPSPWDTHAARETRQGDTHRADGPSNQGGSRGDIHWRQADILDREALGRACVGVGAVFHLAAVADAAASDNASALAVNREGTANVLAAARAAGAGRLIFFSTALAAELDGAQNRQPFGDYERGKWEAERLVIEASGVDGLLTTVLRPAPVYGRGMKGGIASMIRLVSAGRLPPLPKLEFGFSLAGVNDVCEAAVLAAAHRLAPGQCWLITDGQLYTANVLEAAVYQALGRAAPRRRPPAVIFSAAVALLRLGRLAGWRRAATGLRIWRNLTVERTWLAQDVFEELDFQPRDNLYEQLPEIIQDLTALRPAAGKRKRK